MTSSKLGFLSTLGDAMRTTSTVVVFPSRLGSSSFGESIVDLATGGFGASPTLGSNLLSAIDFWVLKGVGV